jgi:hypothetical protein
MLVLDVDSGDMSSSEFIDAFGRNAKQYDRLSFVICNTFSRAEDDPNRYRIIIFYAEPATTVDEHERAYDLVEWMIAMKGLSPKLDPAGRSPVQSFYLPCVNRWHKDQAFFECHNTSSKDIERFGFIPSELPRVEDVQIVQSSDGSFGKIPSEYIDAITADVRSMSDGRHRVFFDTGVRLATLRWQGVRLSEAVIKAELGAIAGNEAHMKKKVPKIMNSLKRYGLLR